jgi:hypothetical protein
MNYENVNWDLAVQNSLADYEKIKNSQGSSGSNSVDLKRYFSIALENNQKSGIKEFRVLPLDPSGKWYEVVRFHNLKVGDKWVKLYDPAQEGRRSPLNDTYNILIKGSKEDKTLANNYRSREFYIMRGIERGKEHEGVKFWRFPLTKDGTGIMDKIIINMEYEKTRPNPMAPFFHPKEGYNLVIHTTKDPAKGYTKISQILFDTRSSGPISEDKSQMDAWLNDSTTWKDLYREKSVDYLEIVAQGFTPVWDKEASKFVAKSDYAMESDSQSTFYDMPTDISIQNTPESANTTPVDIDDLPF